ncbi:hypothetical protein C9422_18730 [Pseudomonas sp. B1(2018)]|uniref:DUF6651 domain-containing protein n=1 Tax=Pseudomonas sp. B1(2018) TaxID=2233856 RepID=UPI000D5CCABB|nr:DUF6651 domain-containing protein [Pseudomonas sp. B1(2018)]PVZ56558.1 hypothetical protein C9422_18730 [Pseudomonas sp. B1(2018)]
MPFKFDADGHIVTQEVNGQKLPVFTGADGKEAPFDADSTVATIGRLNGEAKGHRERAEAAEGKLKGFEGIADPAAALKALTVVKNLDEKNLIAAGDRDKAVSEAVKSVEEKYGPVVQENETLKGQLNSHLIGGAFSQSKFIAEKFAAEGPAGVEIARALFGSSLKVEEGKVVGYDANGSKLYSRTRHGELATAEEAIELLVDAYPHKNHILKSSGGSGGGAPHGGGNGGGKKSMGRAGFDALSPNDQAAFARDGGVVTD